MSHREPGTKMPHHSSMNDFNLLAIMLRFPELSNDEANRLAQPHAWPYFANPNRRWVTFSGFIRLPLEPTGSR